VIGEVLEDPAILPEEDVEFRGNILQAFTEFAKITAVRNLTDMQCNHLQSIIKAVRSREGVRRKS
jgi:hypothetical protein